MKNNALYYPYINVPKSKWLMENLLYWDKLYSIIPIQTYKSKSDITTFTKKLLDNDLLKIIHPRDYSDELRSFEKLILTKGLKFKQKNEHKALRNKFSLIHIEKLGNIVYELKDLKLIEESEKGYAWYKMNKKFSKIFMKELANSLSTITQLNCTPITNKNYKLGKEKIKIKDELLHFSMPVPDFTKDIDLGKIIEFKKSNQSSIIDYRNTIEEITLNILSQKKKYRRDQIEHEKIKLNKIVEELNSEISKSWKYQLKKIIVPIKTFIDSSPTDILEFIPSKQEKKCISYITSLERFDFRLKN